MKNVTLRHRLLLFVLFWMISFGLGYPSLARYNPRDIPGIIDARSYASMVEGRSADIGQHQFRVLLPFLASPIEKIVRGKIGSWSSVQFAMLCVSGLFVAWSALLCISIATKIFSDALIGLATACLYLLSFNVSNFMLAGLVDSVESWSVLAMTWVLFSRRWLLLPVLGIVAALGKETSVFIMVPFGITWYLLERRKEKDTRPIGLWLAAMTACQVAVVFALKSLLDIQTVSVAGGVMPYGMPGPLLDRGMLYTFCWLLPLGVLRIRSLPANWVVSTVVSLACVAAVGLQVGNGVGGNMTRPFFNIMAPVLLLSTASYICEIITGRRSSLTVATQ